jgi:hypothetical protein
MSRHQRSGTSRWPRSRRVPTPMRTFLLISVLMSVAGRGAEESALTMRGKLHARIMEIVPSPPPPKPSSDQNEAAESPVVMKPVIVSESKVIRAVTASIEREEQNRREEQFSPLNGGKIYSIGRLQIGGWWLPGEGWTFLRFNKGPTYRQTEAAEARLKELQELANIGGKPKP